MIRNVKLAGDAQTRQLTKDGPASSEAQGVFPALLSSYGHRTELLAALCQYGPLRAAELRSRFGWGSGSCARKSKSNPAKLLVGVTIEKGRSGGAYGIVGLNPNIPREVGSAMGALLSRMADLYGIRPVKADVGPAERELFRAACHPAVDLDAAFGTPARTRTLIALYVTGYKLELGKLQGSVWQQSNGAVLTAVGQLVDVGVLIRDKVVRFNPRCSFLQEIYGLLNALMAYMPEVVGHALRMRDIRAASGADSARRHGANFRLFGAKVSQAVLCTLAAYGPMRIMQLCKIAAARDASSVERLVESGLVARIPSTTPRHSDLYSLNAHHPLYRELRALLRTEPILNESLPFSKRPLYQGRDLSQPHSKYAPKNLFGDTKRNAVTNILGVLLHTKNEEAEAASLEHMLGEHCYSGVREAMQRLKRQRIVTSRKWKGLVLYRLNEDWPAYIELRELILAMGRTWPDDFALDGSLEQRHFSAHRLARERGRSDPREPAA